MALRTVAATRYVTPLREGGSLPAIVEGDDEGMYVVKFRGAGQGEKALVAEVVAGELARAAGLAVPEIVLVTLDGELARAEPDPEIQALIKASVGLNVGLDYLPGSVTFDPVADRVDPTLASRIVWFDAFTSNIDRSPRNTNMLLWHRKLWLIDHGAALYVHHAASDLGSRARDAFPQVKDHVLLPFASELEKVDAGLAAAFTASALRDVAGLVPETWLGDEPDARRAAYTAYLAARLERPRPFLQEAIRARDALHV
jgi:hypothetical protein